MNHTINTAQVNKCTVSSQRFYNTFILFAFFGSFPEFICQLFSFVFQYCTDRTNSTATRTVYFNNAEVNLFFQQVLQWFTTCSSCLGSRNKYSYTVGNCNYTAFDYFCNHTC